MIIMACAASFSFAQSDDYNKVDIYAGFSHARVDFGGDFEGFNGVEGAVTGNISRYIGLKGDYAFHYKNFDSPAPFDVRPKRTRWSAACSSKTTRRKPRSSRSLIFMAGFTTQGRSGSSCVRAVIGDRARSAKRHGFAGVIGGGVDIKISPRVDFRAIQFDYNPTRLGGETQHNFRVGIGLVFR